MAREKSGQREGNDGYGAVKKIQLVCRWFYCFGSVVLFPNAIATQDRVTAAHSGPRAAARFLRRKGADDWAHAAAPSWLMLRQRQWRTCCKVG